LQYTPVQSVPDDTYGNYMYTSLNNKQVCCPNLFNGSVSTV